MADYRKLFADAIQKQSSSTDPLYAKLEAELQRDVAPRDPNLAPTLGLIDHFTGSKMQESLPKVESSKDRLQQLLALKQGSESQKLGGLKALAGMQSADEAKSAQRAFQEKMFALQSLKAKQKMAAGPKMGSEDKAKFGFANEGIIGIRKLREKIEKGEEISPDMWANNISDSEVNNIRRAIAENYGRMQSGGAISGDEESRFGHLIGGWRDDSKLVKQKLDALESELTRKAALYGGGMPLAGDNTRAPTSAPRGDMDIDSMSDAEIEALYNMEEG